jgi:hypothetical protein
MSCHGPHQTFLETGLCVMNYHLLLLSVSHSFSFLALSSFFWVDNKTALSLFHSTIHSKSFIHHDSSISSGLCKGIHLSLGSTASCCNLYSCSSFCMLKLF